MGALHGVWCVYAKVEDEAGKWEVGGMWREGQVKKWRRAAHRFKSVSQFPA